MKKKTIDNIILILIIIGILGLATFGLFMITQDHSYAVDLDNQTNTTDNSNVTFDVGFAESDSRDITSHSTVANVNPEYTPIYIEIGLVSGSTLTNAKVQFFDSSNDSDLNWDLGFGTVTSDVIASSDDTTKTINFNTLTQGINLRCSMYPEIAEQVAVAKLNETTKAVFTATCTDSSGTVSSVYKEIYFNVGWTGTFTMDLAQYVETYTKNSDKTVTIETTLMNKLNTEGKNNSLPVKQTQLVVDVPTYQGIAPTSVEVTAKKTIATNGKDESNVSFNSSNYSWDSSTGKLTITVTNPEDSSGKVACYRGADEYVIKYTYPEAAYDAFSETATIKNSVTATMTLYSNISTIDVTNTINDNFSLDGQMGISPTAAGKRGLYINSIADRRYVFSWGAGVYLTAEDVTNVAAFRLEFTQLTFKIGTTDTDSYISGKNYAPITTFYIDVTSFSEFLGDSGYIKVYDGDLNLIGTINSSTTVNSDNEYEFDIPTSYQNSAEKYILETSQPITNLARLNVSYDRMISSDLPFTLEQLHNLKSASALLRLYTALTTDPTNFELEEDKDLVVDDKEFADSYTDASLTVVTSTLDASDSDFQDLELKIVLDDTTIFTDPWKTPYFDIELPSYIVAMKGAFSAGINYTSDSNIAFGDAYIKIIDNKLHFIFNCTGVQKYIYETPTTISLKLSVKVDKYASNLSQEIKLYYINDAVYEYKNPGTWSVTPTTTGDTLGFPVLANGTECGIATSEVNFVTDTQLLCVSELSNYNGDNTINSLDNKDSTESIGRDEANPTMTLIIQNNHTVPVSEITVLGRIPYIGNSYAISNVDLGTDINTTLTSNLTQLTDNISNVTIYYSDNLNATKDLTLASNNWVTSPSTLSTIRSYLIVINDTLDVGEQVKFSYEFTVPAGLDYNKTLFANFGAYYTSETAENASESAKIGLTTGAGPVLSAEKTSSIVAGSSVKEGDIITYTITVKNTGEVDATNVIITDNIPENTTYVVANEDGGYTQDTTKKTITENIGTLVAGGTYTYSFSVIVGEISENTTISNTANISADGVETVPSTTSSIPAVTSEPNLILTKTSSIPDGQTVREGDLITYTITVYNAGYGAAQKVTIKDSVPEGTTYYDTTTNTTNSEITELSETRETLNFGDSFSLSFTVKVGRISSTTEIKNTAKVTGDNVPDTSSNTVGITADITVPTLRVVKTSSIAEGTIVKEGDIITYTITVYNDGTTPAYNVIINDTVPEHTCYYENNTRDTSKTNLGHTIPILDAGANESFSFTVIVDEIPTNGSIKNTARVSAENSPEISTNEVDIDSQISVPQLELIKTSSIADGETIKSGDVITYTITVTNIGDCNAHNVVISDDVPEYTIYAEKSGNQYIMDSTKKSVTKTIEILEPGESATLEFSVVVDTLNANVQISNTAKVNANNGDETSSNTVGISAKPKDSTSTGDLPYTGNYSLIIITVIAIVAVTGFTIYEYRRLKK